MTESSHPTRDTDPELLARLRGEPLIAAVAPHLSDGVWAVGGVVRDALRGAAAGPDADLVVEGDAIEEAWRVGRALGVHPATHERFGTAVLELADGHVDFVTARREEYAHPGALPDVERASLDDDLARRDFTVNAVAVRLAGGDAGAIADPHGGRADLRAGVLRALRRGEFTEDPSRVVRAARYAARLALHADPATEVELRAAAPVLDWGSARVAEELRRLLDEESAQPALNLLAAWGAPGLLPHSHPGLADVDAAAARLGVENPPRWALRLGVAAGSDARAAMALPGWALEAARDVAAAPALLDDIRGATRPSQVDAVLSRAPVGTLVGLHARRDERVTAWWEIHRGVELAVGGADLVRHGVPPGPGLGEALRRVRAAVIDGEVRGAREQLALALRVAGVEG